MRNRSRSDPRLRHLPDEKITAEKATSIAGVGLFHIKLILISGLVWMARGFDSVVMRFVTSLLSCSWSLDRRQGAILDGVTLSSTILGCILYGIWSDKYGRKKAFYSVLFLFIFGALSVASPNFFWFVIFRTLAAFSVGGLYQTLVLCLESFPGRKRGQVVYTLAAFWALSVVIMQYILFSTTMRGHGWKLFVAIGTLPALIAVCLMRFYPESFRYRMVDGKYAAANDIMAKMLKGSGKKVTAQLLELPEMRPRKLVWDFFMLPCEGYFFWLLTLGLLTSICYRGLVDWPENTPMTDLGWPPPKKYVEHGFSKVPGRHYDADSMDKLINCIKFIDVGNFQLMTCTTALDFPAYVMYLILADLVNRKILMTASYVLSSICCFLLFTLYILAIYYDISRAQYLFVITSFCARTLLLGQHDLLLLMVAEAFPTSHRGMAVGLEVAIFYLGEILGYVLLADLLMFWEPIQYTMFLIYGGLLIFCLLVSWRKLEESRGKDLKDVYEKPQWEC